MDLPQTLVSPPSGTPPLREAETRLVGNWLIVARVVWGLAAALVLALLLVSLPTYVTHLQTVCWHQPCAYLQLSPKSFNTLQAQGISITGYVALTLALTLGPAIVWMMAGAILVWRRSDDWMALLVAFMLVVVGAGNGLNVGSTLSQAGWDAPANLLSFLNGVAIVVVFLLFPSGHFAPRWTRWLIPVFLLVSFPHQFFAVWEAQLPTWARLLGLCSFVGSLALLILAQVYRYRWVSTPLQRQQTKWILFCISGGIVSLVGWGLLENVIPSLDGSLYSVINAYVSELSSVLLPVAFTIAILRYRLWDIDILINRTLVYGALTALVVALYILVVGYLGAVFRTGGNLLIALVATGLVAMFFQPLREWLQRGVNRLMYGQRDEPYAVIARLGKRLEGTLAPEAILPVIVETLAQALKLPYAAIALMQDTELHFAAAYGAPVGDALSVPLVYQGESVGQLMLAPRKKGEPFSPSDRKLLQDLARQIGVAVHAVRLTSDLQRSRERIVTAREEERRRLRRDLHDGLGPTLAALALKATTVSDLIPIHPEAAMQLSNELYADIRATVGEIRRLVYELRPPRLDELGMVEAIRETARQQSGSGSLRVTVEAPEHLPPLPAAVEVAAYRIVQEALTNVVRHAQASRCTVCLCIDNGLQVLITDNGLGITDKHRVGVGLISMRERAAELDGMCAIEGNVDGGTTVHARLPLSLLAQERN